MSAVSALQNAINRFAVIGGFSRVAVDGIWGAQTIAGVQSALLFVGQGKCYQSACVDDGTARSAASILEQWDQTNAAAAGIGQFLAGVADDLGLPHVASPLPVPGGGMPGALTTFAPGFMDRLRALSVWQQILIGVAAGLGLIFVVNRVKKHKAKPRRA